MTTINILTSAQKDQIKNFGERYHSYYKALYKSQFGFVAYGSAGEEEDWDCYSKKYHRQYGPAHYKYAGARVNSAGRLILENYRENDVFETKYHSDMIVDDDMLLANDMFARPTKNQKVMTRYDIDGIKTGIAVLCGRGDKQYWEHGKTIQEARAEARRKTVIAKVKKSLINIDEFVSDMLHINPYLRITEKDVADIGACKVGIESFKKQYGFNGSSTAAALAGHMSNSFVSKAVKHAALNFAATII